MVRENGVRLIASEEKPACTHLIGTLPVRSCTTFRFIAAICASTLSSRSRTDCQTKKIGSVPVPSHETKLITHLGQLSQLLLPFGLFRTQLSDPETFGKLGILSRAEESVAVFGLVVSWRRWAPVSDLPFYFKCEKQHTFVHLCHHCLNFLPQLPFLSLGLCDLFF